MKVSLKWLNEYVDINLTAREIAEILTMAGTECEEIENLGSDWAGISVGQVTGLDKHPNADRLVLVTINLGEESITVVTGAPNIEEGQKIAFARVGSQLIDGYTGKVATLKPAKIRGVRSEGMVCSEKELGISDNHEGIMVLPPEAPVGKPLVEYIGDTVLDLTPTPNRPDCLSMIGIAREIAALNAQEIRILEISYDEPGVPIEDTVSVEILDPELCSRYCASLVNDVKVGPSPLWMQQRLIASGMRPINNLVDITNYVMLEFGQPLHAFDYKQVKGKKVIIRTANDGESLFTLDGVERELNSDILVIADEKEPIAIAGVMGGADSEVIDTTTSILLESANFNGGSIRRTSTRLNMRSEASLRFEKNISPELAPIALRRATQLLIELGQGKAARGIIDVYPGKPAKKAIMLTRERVSRVLGMEFARAHMEKTLASLGFSTKPIEGSEDLMVSPPYWRTDIQIADDVIEEIARITGYDEIPTTMLRGEIPEHLPAPLLSLKNMVQDLFSGCGMQEVITYSLVSQTMLKKVDPQGKLSPALRVTNPMSQEQEYLRTSLRGALLTTFAANERYNQDSISLFEVGRTYIHRDNDLPEECETACGVMGGYRLNRSWLSGDDTINFFDAKGVLETVFTRLRLDVRFEPCEDQILLPGKTARLIIDNQQVGVLGEVHPKTTALFDISTRQVILFELNLNKLLSLSAEVHRYQPIPRFPGVIRDLAIVLDNHVAAARVQEIITGSPLVQHVTLFDVYTGNQLPEGKKSLAFSVNYRSEERTLTDTEVDLIQDKIIKRLQQELGAVLRS